MASPLRILFAVHGYKPAYRIGGPIVSVASLAENLVKRGHQVVVFTSNSNLDEELDVPLNQAVMIDGVEVWYFKKRDFIKKYLHFIPYFSQSMGYLYLPELRSSLRQRIDEFDLIHTHMTFGYPTQAVANMGIRRGIPLFYQQRGAFAPAYLRFRSLKKHLYISLIEKPIMRKATFLIALTDAEITSYRHLGVDTPCRVIPNGIALTEYSQDVEPEFSINEYFSIKRDDFLILFLARLHTIKGADFLLEVFLEIFKKYPGVKLALAGPDQHNIQKNLISRINSAGAAKRVCLPGMVTGELKRKLLARANLFCHPSMAEGFSMSILEAMASATPVLATPECNFIDIEREAAGWIVERDLKKWVAKISDILENRDQLPLLGRNAFQLVARDYSWETVVPKLEAVYLEGVRMGKVNV